MRKNKLIHIRTELYTHTDLIEVHIVRAVSGKWMIFRKRRARIFLFHWLTLFGGTLKNSFVLDVEDDL